MGPNEECLECGYETDNLCQACDEHVCEDCEESHNDWEHSDQESEL